MGWGHVSHELANLGFQVLVILGAFLCFQLFKRSLPRNEDGDRDSYVLVDSFGRKFTVTLKFDCYPEQEQDRDRAEQLKTVLNGEQ